MPVIEIYVGYMDGRWETQLIHIPRSHELPSESDLLKALSESNRNIESVSFCGIYNESPISAETEEENELP